MKNESGIEKSIENMPIDDIFSAFINDNAVSANKPEKISQMDPRNNIRAISAPMRSKRPQNTGDCPICDGNTTSILDVTGLSEGCTFINKNLFPALYPFDHKKITEAVIPGTDISSRPLTGLHFVQWTSSIHDRDWHNMILNDRLIVLLRLAALEKKLLLESKKFMPSTDEWSFGKNTYGFISVMKNVGSEAGSSISHGHQQILFSNTIPKAIMNDWNFLQLHGRTFTEYLMLETDPGLVIRDYGSALLVVPYFMLRPFHMMLVLKNTSKQFLYELDFDEIEALADGMHHASSILMNVMTGMNRNFSYNALFHNGPGAGIYIEFMPSTQKTGGFEHLGLWVCDNTPENAASSARELIDKPPV
ncbi:MAG: hypothetical protein JXA66_00350 [Oligoflexia bacterium]|nr:hypothetical protein [Oligoflexia bacterium]